MSCPLTSLTVFAIWPLRLTPEDHWPKVVVCRICVFQMDPFEFTRGRAAPHIHLKFIGFRQPVAVILHRVLGTSFAWVTQQWDVMPLKWQGC